MTVHISTARPGRLLLTFFLLVLAGGAGGFFGSVAGAAFGRKTIFFGGVLGGLITSPTAALLAARLRWIDPADATATALGAAIGFLAATAIAVNTLSSPWGPVLSPLLVGAGGLAGRALRSRAVKARGLQA
jgi:hypothetical protein